MKYLGPLGMTFGGGGVVLLSLLFLLGGKGQSARYSLAVLGLTLGGALTGLGVLGFKQRDSLTPEQLRHEILTLAQGQNGTISEAEVLAALGRRAEGAGAVLAAMEADRLCQRRQNKDSFYFEFTSRPSSNNLTDRKLPKPNP